RIVRPTTGAFFSVPGQLWQIAGGKAAGRLSLCTTEPCKLPWSSLISMMPLGALVRWLNVTQRPTGDGSAARVAVTEHATAKNSAINARFMVREYVTFASFRRGR